MLCKGCPFQPFGRYQNNGLQQWGYQRIKESYCVYFDLLIELHNINISNYVNWGKYSGYSWAHAKLHRNLLDFFKNHGLQLIINIINILIISFNFATYLYISFLTLFYVIYIHLYFIPFYKLGMYECIER